MLFIAHIYDEFFGDRVANKRLILPKAVGILDVHFGFLKNEFENGLFLPTLLFFIWLLLQPHSMGNDRLEILDSLSLVAQITWKTTSKLIMP